MAALDDSPRSGKEPTITDGARAWVVSLACQKPKEGGILKSEPAMHTRNEMQKLKLYMVDVIS
jgi:hypothetical protein